MKKSLIALLISSVLALSACDDQATTKLLEAEKHIVQLEASLKAKETDLNAAQEQVQTLQSEVASALQQIETLQNDVKKAKQRAGEFPALQVKIVDLFNKQTVVKHKVDPNDEFAREESSVAVSVSTAKTGIEWLDTLLLQSLVYDENGKLKKNVSEADVIADAEKAFNEFIKDAKEGRPIGLSYNVRSYYVGQRGNIATFTQLFDTYTGGAHGMYSTTYLNIDANKKAVISLNDLVPKQNQAKLKQRLWENYSYDRVDDQGRFNGFVGENDFYISENFYFTPEGIRFVYRPYELGPFSDGEVEIFAYFPDLKELMNPEYYPAGKDYIE